MLGPLGVAAAAGAVEVFPSVGAQEPNGLRQLPLPPDGCQFVALHAGGQHPYKAWNPASFAALAGRLRDELGLAPVLVGGASERRAANAVMRIAARSEIPLVSAVGPAPLGDTAALIRKARLFVGTDSGLAHLAGAIGIPTVVLFGPSDHAKWGWTGPRHAVARKDLPCSPCFIFGYHRPCGTVACMKAIGVNDVLAACRAVLQGEPAQVSEG
ncbi:MAG: glycosyltransferase family 9 protein [Verrucomicrobiota bacterium]|nr:glycosyltransferase family 9 protein [Verrucomicrobiota bacterium]